MIHYFFENVEQFPIESNITNWLENLIQSETKKVGEINYIFCDDEYLLQVNKDFLDHDYYTDIITFDYVKGKIISGDIFVSLQRVKDNSSTLSTEYDEELKRVLAHGILHLCGYKDKSQEDETIMREKENYYLNKFKNNLY